jgi:tetratricopeptide (TPR) repeat protein
MFFAIQNFAMILGIFAYIVTITSAALSSELSHSSSCDFFDVTDLFESVNLRSKISLERIQISVETEVGPHLAVAITSPFKDVSGMKIASQDDMRNASINAFAVNEYYARINGYGYFLDTSKPTEDYRLHWTSVRIIREALNGWAKNMDYLVYTTLDNIFIDFNFRVEQFFQKYKKSNVILIQGGAMTGARISTDIILVRNNLWTLDFFDDWWSFHDSHPNSEVTAFEDYSKLYEEEMKETVTILSISILRNDYPATSKFRSANQILSFPLEISQFKRAVFEEAYDVLCETEKKTQPGGKFLSNLPPLLGITKSSLITHSVEAYRSVWEARMEEYAALAPDGEANAEQTDRLSTIAVHLAATLDHAEGDQELLANESLRVRSKTFKQAYLNLKRYRDSISEGSPQSAKVLAKKYPPFITLSKSTLRLGQEYLARVKDSKERKLLIQICRDILEDLLAHDNKDIETQEALVNMDVDLGMISMNEKKYQAALADFLAALRVARRVGNWVGDRIVLTPANEAAEAMVMLERFKEASVLYDTVVPLAKKHNGESDLTTAYIMVQASYANHKYGKHHASHKLVEKALEIFVDHGVDVSDENIFKYATNIYDVTRGKRDEVDVEENEKDYVFEL